MPYQSAAAEGLLSRTRAFALAIINLSAKLPNKPAGWVLGKQVLRSGTSVGANYREAQRARSTAEFLSKIQICRQELEETVYWLDLILHSECGPVDDCQTLLDETVQLSSIFAAIALKTEQRQRTAPSLRP